MHRIKNYGKKLNEFYNSELGRICSWFVRKKIAKNLINKPIAAKEKILSFGFGNPYYSLFENLNISLTPFRTSFSNEIISEYDKLPVRDASYDRIFAFHAIDNYEYPEQVISEFWRILEPEGKLTLIVVNCNGLWNNSFADGISGLNKSYIKEALSFNKFYTHKIHQCLYFPPAKNIYLVKLLNILGKFLFPSKCGVYIFEAEKKVFAPRGRPVKVTPSLKDIILKPKKALSN